MRRIISGSIYGPFMIYGAEWIAKEIEYLADTYNLYVNDFLESLR